MSRRLSRGRSTPAMRAMVAEPAFLLSLSLPLLVARVRADHEDRATPPDHPAAIAHPLDRRTDLHALTVPLLVPVHHTASGEAVGGQFHADPVPREDPDVVHPHLPRDVGQHLVPVLQLHAEHGVGQWLDHRALDLDDVVFGHAPAGPLRSGFPTWAREKATVDRVKAEYTSRSAWMS